MTNPQAGEVILATSIGPRPLRLSLSALAEIEALLGVEDLSALGPRLAAMTMAELNDVIAILLRAGGETRPVEVDPVEAATALTELFTRSARAAS
ncbi:MAG: gene transfer agent family protein [Oceanicaulis sp.]|uniref:GTA-gp10 family protein n=1 Tax=Glycocaulis sp. TaxID=1969725 RepID=UPI0025B914DD|nr:GTA-gp10 family protein [Glycocaulis sp.]MCC5980354.1 gene transfer agent family protein [Oceanicaulis sp.]MCH8522226.1 GTA-gp10 family protein [Glycocaulis sp.]